MSRSPNVLAAFALALIAASAWLVAGLASRQVLDAPGVAVAPVPLLDKDGRLVRSNSIALPKDLPGYIFERLPISEVELEALPPDTVFGRARYVLSDGNWVQINVVLMGTDRTSIHRPEYCLTGVGWRIRSQRELPFADSGPGPGRVQRFDCQLKTEMNGRPVDVGGVYVFWFVSRDKQTASHWDRQWWMVRDLVTRGVLQRWAYISFFTPCVPGDEDAAYQRVSELIRQVHPHFGVTSGPGL